MVQNNEALTPTAAIAARVRELRDDRGWSAAKLAGEMTAAGISWDRMTVTKLENGTRQSVRVEELLALAAVLGVSPLHLLVPPYPSPLWGGTGDHASDVARSPDDPNDPNDHLPYQVTPALAVPCNRVRQWVRSYEPLPGGDLLRFLQAMPPQERPDNREIQRRIRIRKDRGDE